VRRLAVACACLLMSCTGAQTNEPAPYRPLPTETERIDKSPACLKACAHLREMQCGFDEVHPCEDWLCAAEFQNFAELLKIEACPL